MTPWTVLAEIADLGDAIRERRAELGLTQAALSDLTGIPQAEISRIENDRIDARWSTVLRLFEALADGHPARRSLANGGAVDAPPLPTNRWVATGLIAPIGAENR